MDIRNIAIIAHVDHGKTTLVDALLKAGGAFAAYEHVEKCVMDSNELEKERGITIYSKNAAITYKDTKINIVDTPGHADFGSEVERILSTVDATILVVDAFEGPMPQTKFVLQKSLALKKKVLVVVNKIDKSSARPNWVIDQVFDLFVKLGASPEQLDFPYMYAIAREGIAILDLLDERKDITPLLEFILEHVPAAPQNINAVFRMQPATLAYDNFLGRLAIGRVHEGMLSTNQAVVVLSPDGKKRNGRATKIFTFQGLKRIEVSEVSAGDVVAIAGIADIYVGETIAGNDTIKPLPAIRVDPPSLAMYFMVNDSPFAGTEGKFVTSRQIRARLEKELETNVGLKIEFSENADHVKVLGRGEMHLSVLIECMRREGFELQVSQPEVVFQEKNGQILEPMENVVINVPEEIGGKIIELMSQRKGEMVNLQTENGLTTLEFLIPARGILGIRSNFIILTRGEGTLYSSFSHFAPHVGPIQKRQVGSLISAETGNATAYALWNLQERGAIFIHPTTKIYEGMILGEHNQGNDLTVNAIKGKKLTNVRASGTDEAIVLTPPIEMTLEKAMEYIKEDEYVEVTPKNIRLRKKWLTEIERKRNREK
ncbi:translational GTPase TypA [Candidatus Peregrinibacteria bacterium]|nr:translational GTPase TypA [Candidatus Peregrinibacteria bacterium]